MMPVVPMTVPTIEDLEGGDLEQALDLTIQLTKFNRPIGYLGLPSICVPAGKAGGLPTSFQLVDRPFAEAQLLNFAHLFLRETGFDRDCPPGV
jgi:aspartyl-tRNA(Asn)/glutamyl-tRNA(Gln) amidotransferase subunit A